MARVVVVGSINRDISMLTQRFPTAGETVLGSSVVYGLGGKGANQAVAAARAGASVAFVAAVGDDDDGAYLRDQLRGFGVDSDLMTTAPGTSSGTAHIVLDASRQNTIIVVPGANATLTAETVRAARNELARAGAIVVQCEIPPAAVEATVRIGSELGIPVVLNLAPAIDLEPDVLKLVSALVVNETEAAFLLRGAEPATVAEASAMASELTERVPAAIVTLGASGAVVAQAGKAPVHVPAPDVPKVVDTTGAGDAMVGVLGAALAAGHSLERAAAAAVRAGTASVAAMGAARSYPRFDVG